MRYRGAFLFRVVAFGNFFFDLMISVASGFDAFWAVASEENCIVKLLNKNAHKNVTELTLNLLFIIFSDLRLVVEIVKLMLSIFYKTVSELSMNNYRSIQRKHTKKSWNHFDMWRKIAGAICFCAGKSGRSPNFQLTMLSHVAKITVGRQNRQAMPDAELR
jgi:hypothetical protein